MRDEPDRRLSPPGRGVGQGRDRPAELGVRGEDGFDIPAGCGKEGFEDAVVPGSSPPGSAGQFGPATGVVALAHPGENHDTIASTIASLAPDEPLTLLIGPEGGFSGREVEEARRAGAIAVSLGPTRLRSETAAIVAVALAVAVLDDRATAARPD